MRAVKLILFLTCLLPLLRAGWIVGSGAAVNPVEFALRSTGTWALVGLLLTLSITPLRQLTGVTSLIRYRRMLGLFAFFYAALHFSIWAGLEHFLDLAAMLRDIARRPFITVGFASFLMLLALAITSTRGWMHRLKKNWVRLHRLVYPAAILSVLHYWWLVKLDTSQPARYAAVLFVLLLWRLVYRFYRKAPEK